MDNGRRCSPPAHILAPLAHEYHRINTNQFFILGKGKNQKTKNRAVLFVPDDTPGINFENRRVSGNILDEATAQPKATFSAEAIRLLNLFDALDRVRAHVFICMLACLDQLGLRRVNLLPFQTVTGIIGRIAP